MLKKLIILATLFAGLAACSSKSKTARDYNNTILAKEKSLQPQVTAIEANVTKYFNAGQYDKIAEEGENMERSVQKTIDEINAMPVPKAKEADNFKAAVIRYFTLIKSVYTNYKEFGLAATEEKRQEILQEIQKIVSQKEDNLNDMQRAQRKFADANGFRLEAKTN